MKLPDRYEVHTLDYPEAQKGDAFEDYCRRLGATIRTDAPFVLIGHSMGGMIASELAHYLKPQKTILISSASSSLELPPYFKWMRKAMLPYIIPPPVFKVPTPVTHWLLGARRKENRELNGAMLRDFSPRLFTWAFRHIPEWKRRQRPEHLFQLHGTADRILPLRWVKPDVIIPGGTHLMFLENEAVMKMVLEQLP